VSDSDGKWSRRSVWLAGGFGAILIVTGVTGLLSPHADALMSHAVPYDAFHIVFGSLGVAAGLRRSHTGASLFNVGFGAIDLWQVVAGLTGLFPAPLFELKPADHVVHLALAAVLMGVGVAGWRALAIRRNH
jgi:hypothetical protein